MTPLALSDKASSYFLHHLESSLLPRKNPLIQRVAIYAVQMFRFLAALPFAVAFSLTSHTFRVIASYAAWIFLPKPDTLEEFAKHPDWSKEVIAETGNEVERLIGFSTAEFQDGGYACGKSQWTKHYQDILAKFRLPEEEQKKLPKIPGEEYLKGLQEPFHAPELMNDPKRLVAMLQAVGAKNFRFSVDWSVIDPEMRFLRKPDKDGSFIETTGLTSQEIDLYLANLAVQTDKYINLAKVLIENDIEPTVTLHHFTDPESFDWRSDIDLDSFVGFSVYMGSILAKEVGVKKIITHNEPMVQAFQSFINGEFPPFHKIDFESLGQMMERMMRTHQLVYDGIKEECKDLEDEVEIGISHDPIRFRHYHKWHPLWSPIERIMCHYLTEICHNAQMRYFKTGVFSLKVPFFANIEFKHEKPPSLDFLGLQYYSDPLLQLSFTGGRSTTRVPGEQLSAYEYRTSPEKLASAIEEFAELGLPIDITEVGIDVNINHLEDDAERIAYYEKIMKVVQLALNKDIDIRSVQFWTLVSNYEWSRGKAIDFGWYSFDEKRKIYLPRRSLYWLQERIKNIGLEAGDAKAILTACS